MKEEQVTPEVTLANEQAPPKLASQTDNSQAATASHLASEANGSTEDDNEQPSESSNEDSASRTSDSSLKESGEDDTGKGSRSDSTAGKVSDDEGGSGSEESKQSSAKNRMKNIDRSKLRKGKWVLEEEDYASRIIQFFNSGLLNLPEGKTLRSYMASKLNCDPMRITKKYAGATCLGRRMYHLQERQQPTASDIAMAKSELEYLEKRFRLRVYEGQVGEPLPRRDFFLPSQGIPQQPLGMQLPSVNPPTSGMLQGSTVAGSFSLPLANLNLSAPQPTSFHPLMSQAPNAPGSIPGIPGQAYGAVPPYGMAPGQHPSMPFLQQQTQPLNALGAPSAPPSQNPQVELIKALAQQLVSHMQYPVTNAPNGNDGSAQPAPPQIGSIPLSAPTQPAAREPATPASTRTQQDQVGGQDLMGFLASLRKSYEDALRSKEDDDASKTENDKQSAPSKLPKKRKPAAVTDSSSGASSYPVESSVEDSDWNSDKKTDRSSSGEDRTGQSSNSEDSDKEGDAAADKVKGPLRKRMKKAKVEEQLVAD